MCRENAMTGSWPRNIFKIVQPAQHAYQQRALTGNLVLATDLGPLREISPPQLRYFQQANVGLGSYFPGLDVLTSSPGEGMRSVEGHI